jgi:protein TonB
MIEQRGFTWAIWAAFGLHIAVFLTLGLMQIKNKDDFPFQIVNIRLAEHITRKPATAFQAESPKPQATIVQPPAPIPAAKPKPPEPKIKPEKEGEFQKEKLWKRERGKDEKFRPVARTLEDYVQRGAEELVGIAPESDEAVRQRFTQVLSLWLYKFRDYPEAARAAGVTGRALIRLRIERSGRVLFYQLDRSTGYAILDSAIRDMVYRASPVPEAPAHFPGGQQLEFLIPIAFSLD